MAVTMGRFLRLLVGFAALFEVSAHTLRRESKATEVGCCYKIGFGSMMKPCCLTTSQLEEASCFAGTEGNIGGGVGWRAGSDCPSTAEQAFNWIQEDEQQR